MAKAFFKGVVKIPKLGKVMIIGKTKGYEAIETGLPISRIKKYK